jgi:myo-inositol-1-phosphate synthase
VVVRPQVGLLNNGISGALEAPSAYLMKSPPKQIPDAQAHDAVERFIAQHARKPARAKAQA